MEHGMTHRTSDGITQMMANITFGGSPSQTIANITFGAASHISSDDELDIIALNNASDNAIDNLPGIIMNNSPDKASGRVPGNASDDVDYDVGNLFDLPADTTSQAGPAAAATTNSGASTTGPVEAPGTTKTGGQWYCGHCGDGPLNIEIVVACPVCGAARDSLATIYLYEFEEHDERVEKRGTNPVADAQWEAACDASLEELFKVSYPGEQCPPQ
ncbi:MAG: hypothetical protein M1823_004159 [Watsoniomyces obsoletus]|nr:MAG: hypothetical protein M1823_004159 [Watsoniomyces obsoletus]